MAKKKRKLKVNPSTGAVVGYLLLGVGALAAVGVGMAYALGSGMKTMAKGLKEAAEELEDDDGPKPKRPKDKPKPKPIDTTKGSADVQRKIVTSQQEAINFIGVDAAERAIRTNRPVVWMIVGDDDIGPNGDEGFDELFEGIMDFTPRPDHPHPHIFVVEDRGTDQPRGEAVLGAIWIDENGSVLATRPTMDMRWRPGVGGRQPGDYGRWLADIIAGEDFAADVAELPPEVVQAVKGGKSLDEAMLDYKSKQQA